MTKTLAMIKMEKNFIAVNDKGKPRKPYESFTTAELLDKLDEEVAELREAVFSALEPTSREGSEPAKKECADISNVIDIIFERLANGRLR